MPMTGTSPAGSVIGTDTSTRWVGTETAQSVASYWPVTSQGANSIWPIWFKPFPTSFSPIRVTKREKGTQAQTQTRVAVGE